MFCEDSQTTQLPDVAFTLWFLFQLHAIKLQQESYKPGHTCPHSHCSNQQLHPASVETAAFSLTFHLPSRTMTTDDPTQLFSQYHQLSHQMIPPVATGESSPISAGVASHLLDPTPISGGIGLRKSIGKVVLAKKKKKQGLKRPSLAAFVPWR